MLRTHEVEWRFPKMKKSIAFLASAGLLSFSMCLVGCGDSAGVRQEVEATGPGGTTRVERETTVETTGDNPPAATPATPADGTTTTP